MSHIVYSDKPELTRPILVAAFGGWGDAGHAATLALQQLVSSLSATKFAEIDPEEFFDFSSDRPWVKLGTDGQQQMTWPVNSLFAHKSAEGGLDTILFLGTEPGLRWRTFSHNVVELAKQFDVSMVVTLGAFHAQISHRDPVSIAGWAWPSTLSDKLSALSVNQVAYEGPTSIVTALSCALADARIPVASLWAAVPAFLGGTPNPKAALALLKRLDDASDLNLDLKDLVDASKDFERNVDRVIKRARSTPGANVFQSSDERSSAPAIEIPTEQEPIDLGELPSADEVIRDAEEFLKGLRGT